MWWLGACPAGRLCALATVAGFLFHYFDLPALGRALILLSLLGAITLAATLGLTFLLPEIRLELPGLLGIFAVNALFGIVAVWLGTLMGNWLWSISKLP